MIDGVKLVGNVEVDYAEEDHMKEDYVDSKNKCGASFKVEEAGNVEQDGVGDEKIATSCVKSGGEVEESGAEDVGRKSGVVLGKRWC